ncbi:hypothetical protein AYI70_g11489 [Smittium culicis]|uniref:Mediator of RNA polymerase II transcription subunit 8 n=1 Tax=Smittium culicis TaxID=133412 RepID=A0A1R1X1K1_9FUNG|nr:hypothetical protein AYI70_g11489 [Smittium culicis]
MSLVAEDRKAELLSLKSKLLQLIDSYDYFINSLQQEVFQSSFSGHDFEPNWLDIFSKFNILAAKYSVLVEDIGKAQKQVLSKVIVFPGKTGFEPTTLAEEELLINHTSNSNLNAQIADGIHPSSNSTNNVSQMQKQQQYLQLQQQRISVLLRTKLTPKLELAEKLIEEKIRLHKVDNEEEFGSLRYWKNYSELHDMLSLSAAQIISRAKDDKPKIKATTAIDNSTALSLESIMSFLNSG